MATKKDKAEAAVAEATKKLASLPLPTNQQIEEVLEKTQSQVQVAHQQTEGLDPVGHQLLTDVERVVASARRFVEEKNEGDKVQRLIIESKLASKDLAKLKDVQKEALEGIPTERLRELARQTLQTSRMVAIELLRSRRFRRELREVVALIGDILEEGVSTGEETGEQQQGEKQQGGVEQRATYLPNEVPVHVLPPTVVPVTYGYPTFGRPVEIPIEGAEETKAITPVQETKATTPVQETGLAQKLQEGVRIGKARIKLSPEQMDALLQRFNELLRDITSRPATQNLFGNLLEMVRIFEEETPIDKIESSVRSVTASEHLRNVLVLSKEIFESFTGPHSLDPLIEHFKYVSKTLASDPEARALFNDIRTYLVGILDDPTRIGTEEANKEFVDLVGRARQLHNEKLYDHINGILREVKTLINKAESDPATLRLKNDIKQLVADLALDEQGHPTLKPHVLEQLRLIIIQCMVERMRIPIPNVNVEKPNLDLRLSNMVLTLRDLVPERVVVKNKGKVAIDFSNLRTRGLGTEVEGQLIVFKIKNVNVYMEDANIWFRRKKFPKIQDEGKLRLNIGGSGVDLRIAIRVLRGTHDLFQVETVKCNVHQLQIHLLDTKHDFLYNSTLKVLKPRIISSIEHSVENNISDYLQRINRLLSKQIASSKGAAKSVLSSSSSTLKGAIEPVKNVAHKLTGATH